MKLQDFIKVDQTRLFFKYTDVNGERKEYDHPTVISNVEDEKYGNTSASTVPIEGGVVKDIDNIVLQLTSLDGIVGGIGITPSGDPPAGWFDKPAFIPLAAKESEMIHGALATYGHWWFQQNNAFDLNELKDNPMFKKGLEAAREGLIFSTWFIGMTDSRGIDMDAALQRGMSKENWDKIINSEVVGLPISLVGQAADVLEISLDAMAKLLEDEGVLKREEKKHDAGVQPQTEVPEDAPGTGDVPNDSVPLEGKPEGR